MNEKYNIKTIKEILEIVNEKNVDGFITDFSNWLRFRLIVQSKQVKGVKMIIDNEDTFNWIDDGKSNIKLNIELREDTNPSIQETKEDKE